MLIVALPLAVDPAKAQGRVEGFVVRDAGDARAFLADLQPQTRDLDAVVGLQPGLPGLSILKGESRQVLRSRSWCRRGR